MSYGFIPTASATTNTTSQPSQNPASGSAHTSSLNPDAPEFIPRAERAQRIDGHSNRLPTISGRQVTADETFASRTFQQRTNVSCPDAITEAINKAFEALTNKKFIDAEAAFRLILDKNESSLSKLQHQSLVIGLARSLKEQTYTKQKEACSRLEELRSKAPLNDFGASTIHSLDLTLSLCEEALGQYIDAEKRLLRLRNKKPDADEQSLCEPSDNFGADMTIGRLWQLMEKHMSAETLVMKLRTKLIIRLQSASSAAIVKALHRNLHTVNLSLAIHWQAMGKYKWAESTLLSMIRRHPDDSEEILCSSSGKRDIDLALARLWIAMGQYERSERLLLNVIGKHPDNSEEILYKPSGRYDYHLTLARLWQTMGQYQRAERLLLKMSGKHPDNSEEILCKPCGNHDIDLTLVRHWQISGKHELSERLLLSMTGINPDNDEEILCQPCGNYEVDIALVRLWKIMDKHELSERLLLSMINRSPDDSEEILCKPSGNNKIDLTRVRLWQEIGKTKLAEKLLLNMTGKRPDDSEENLCKISGKYVIDLALAILWQVMGNHEQSERLLLNMSGKSTRDSEDILCKPSGIQELDMALARTWQALGKYESEEKLLSRGFALYRSDEFELALLCLSIGQSVFMERMTRYPDSVNKLLATSLHYFTLACRQIIKDGPKSGDDNLNKALEHVESALEKYPPNAGAFSQKAHCLRMMGAAEPVWRELFLKSKSLDPLRAMKNKNDSWRSMESAALQKIKNLTD
ncbi:tetratricopeptide repeat protein [Endozoicomonas sp. 2B-B]